MISTSRRAAGLLWAALFATIPLLSAPSAEPAPVSALSAEEKERQIAELEKQLRDVQAKLDAVRKAPYLAPPPRLVETTPEGELPESLVGKLPWRSIGPANMGGRITAIAVVESDPTTYFVATASGGLVKTTNNGTTFSHLFDRETTVSIGDVAVAPSNPNIVWVGTGEANPRNSVSYGDGVYKSVDGGKTWKNKGLAKTFQIGKILIHPSNPDIVYVGALGRLYGSNPERGLFKTVDGGKSWNRVLHVDDRTGVIDARLDPQDPETLIVATWERKRDEFDGFFGEAPVPDPYGPIVTHAPGSAIWKSPDGGKTWKRLSGPAEKRGLPTVKLGRIGLDYSRKTKGLLYAIVDSEKVGTGEQVRVYMGIIGEDAEGGGAKITDVTKDGPAEKAGLKPGDIVVSVGETKVAGYEKFVDQFLDKKPGDKLKLTVKRDGKTVPIEVTLGSRPISEKKTNLTPVAGFRPGMGDPLTVESVTDDGPAAKAGILPGDAIVAVDGRKVESLTDYITIVRTKKPGDQITLTILREKMEKKIAVTLAAPPSSRPVKPYGMGLGGQTANSQNRQGREGYQTGGVYVSRDNGETWERVNSVNPRPMYFSTIRVDPTDDKTIYLLGDVPLWKSTDGGNRFEAAPTKGVHPDHHALWIDPRNGRHMILGTDGGFYTTFDRGQNWDHLNVLALGQFYHVAVDTRRPYRVYGGLQDNGSWGGPSHSLRGPGPVNEDWGFVNGGDGFVCRVDPTDPDLVYSESQNGAMFRRNYRTGERAFIRPSAKSGEGPLRFNWNTPFFLSHHNPSIFYCGCQYVYRSVKKGDDPRRISPELTRTKQGSLTALGESPRNPEVLWAGSDDGFLWVSRDGGGKWQNVAGNLTRAGVPGYRWVSSIEPSREKEGRCYIVLDGHRSDDDRPYVLVTEDFGANWKSITSNLPSFGSTRVLREDIVNANLLYLGTEFGAWASANRGASWSKLGEGLPTVAVHEFAQPTTASELVAGTHGRSVWVLDINALRQATPAVLKAKATLFAPAVATRWKLEGSTFPYSSAERKFVGQNPYRGATFEYLLAGKPGKVGLKIFDAGGKVVREFRQPPASPGFHRLQWNLAGPPAKPAPGGRVLSGSQVQPGVYRVVLTVDKDEFSQLLTVELDPNASRDLVSTDAIEFAAEEEEEEREREMEKGRERDSEEERKRDD